MKSSGPLQPRRGDGLISRRLSCFAVAAEGPSKSAAADRPAIAGGTSCGIF